MRCVIVLVVAIMLLTDCSAKSSPAGYSGAPVSSSGDFSMTLSFEPSPPKRGNETVTVTLKDAVGNPVTGATVKISTSMPAMSMTGPILTAQDNSDGTYSAVTNLNYETQWVFEISAIQGGKSAKATFKADIPS